MARAENHTENYYLVLGISKSADTPEIKAAFRRLARQHHPDLNPDNPKAAEKFKLISQAYDVLSDPTKRRRYDRNIPQPATKSASNGKSSAPRHSSQSTGIPKTALDFYNRGLIRVQAKEYRQAVSDYGQAIKLNPRFVDAYLKRCEMLYKLGDNQGVLNDCYEVCSIDPTVAKAYYYQGRARFSLGYIDPAIESYGLAIAQDRDYPQAYYYRGMAHKEQKSNAAAINDLTKAAELFRQQKNYDAYRRTQKIVNELSGGRQKIQSDGALYNFLATLGLSLFNPQGGLLAAFSRLHLGQLRAVSIVYGLISSLCFVCSYFMIGLLWRFAIWELFFLGLIPFFLMLFTGIVVRLFWHHQGNLEIDMFLAGVAIAPIALVAVLLGFVPGLAWSLILPLIFLGSCYSALTLQAGYVQILNLTEAKASSVVAIMLMSNSFLSYFFIASLVA